jgi:hypothetical protein
VSNWSICRSELQLRDAGATEQRARLAARVKELEAWAGHVKEVGPAICQEKLGGWGREHSLDLP